MAPRGCPPAQSRVSGLSALMQRARSRTGDLALVSPALAVVGVLLLLPLVLLTLESFRQFISGQIGAAANAPLTLANYANFLQPAYFGYLVTTLEFALGASAAALVVGYFAAYSIARLRSPGMRKLAISVLVLLVFVSALVKIYALQLSFGSVGFVFALARRLGIAVASPFYTDFTVAVGLFQAILPMCALILIGTIQNIGRRLEEAALVLGAAHWRVHWEVVLPLAFRGLMSAYLISFSYCISAFIVPMILGRGRVVFISNIIYARFSDLADYPGGAAVSVGMLLISLALIYVIGQIGAARWGARSA